MCVCVCLFVCVCANLFVCWNRVSDNISSTTKNQFGVRMTQMGLSVAK